MLKLSNILLTVTMLVTLVGCSSTPYKRTSSDEAKMKRESAANTNSALGMLYLQKGDTHRAKQRFLQALEESPKDPTAWYSIGYFFEVMGENTKAEQSFLRAIKLDPQNGDAKNNYGTFLCHTGRYQEGIKQFHAAISAPKYLNTTGAYENIGLCAMKIPDYNLAKQYLEKALALNPKQPESLEALAKIYYQEHKNDLAIKYLNQYKALTTTPDKEMIALEAKLKKA